MSLSKADTDAEIYVTVNLFKTFKLSSHFAVSLIKDIYINLNVHRLSKSSFFWCRWLSEAIIEHIICVKS